MKKKSYHYEIAMCAVIETARISTLEKLDILETLMADKRLAKYGEEQEAEKNAALS